MTPSRRRFLTAAALGFCLGCAASEPIDIDDLAKSRGTPAGDPTGLAGAGGPGIAGTTGAGASGVAGSVATAGTTGAAGSKTMDTSGQAGTTGNAGTGGSGGDNVSGQAGTTGSAGTTGRGGTTGFAGTTGTGGRGGTTGFAGTTGGAGRGGTTGAAGRGGTTGSAGSGGSSVDGGTNPDGAATQTFTDIYMTILTPFCAGSSCHNPGSQGGVGFSSQSSAYSAVKSRVTAGNGTGSRFYMTVNSGSMPRGQAKLSAANLLKIKTWIDQGALNN
jgi:hypothetical protein